jgi:hypothetical protein
VKIRLFVISLTNWRQRNETAQPLKAPLIVQSTFEITDEPADTFVDMSAWSKGIVFINGFNLGRYFNVGPQQTLYLPSPFLKTGVNTVSRDSSSFKMTLLKHIFFCDSFAGHNI